MIRYSPATFSTGAQPKAVAVAGDSTVFIAEASSVEAVRANQKVSELQTKYVPSAIAATGSIVAIGGEVSMRSYLINVERSRFKCISSAP